MAKRRWPTNPEAIVQTECGIIDDTIVTVRPTPEELEAMRIEVEAFLAARRAGRQPDARPRRGGARRRTSA